MIFYGSIKCGVRGDFSIFIRYIDGAGVREELGHGGAGGAGAGAGACYRVVSGGGGLNCKCFLLRIQ